MDSRLSARDWRSLFAPTLDCHPICKRPGRSAQVAMSPRLTYGRHFGPVFPNARPAAVLVLICRIDDEWRVPFTVRPDHLRDHAGQVSLPGGVLNQNESSENAAIRELNEELGCNTESIKIVGQMSEVYVYNSNFIVTPWVAVTEATLEFNPNPDEVADWFSLPLAEITSSPKIATKQIRRGSFHFTAPCFESRAFQIWGATSMILSEFRHFLRQTELAVTA